jgi:hypothetical protein
MQLLILSASLDSCLAVHPQVTRRAAENKARMLTIKISHGTEIRRFSTSHDKLNWIMLSERVNTLFSLPTETRFVLTYDDEEGDKITMSSEEELAEALALALAKTPVVLRLAVVVAEAKKTTAEAGTTAKPRTADAATTGGASAPPREVHALLNTLGAQLPALLAQLPDGVRRLIPNAELDIAASLAANAASNASCAAAQARTAAAAAAEASVHVGVTCDKSGMNPIVGMRYHLVGHNYDLCQAEYDKLDDKEKQLFQPIPPPFVANLRADAEASPAPSAVTGPHPLAHPGVECDRSGMCPIVGMRWNLAGHDYDLCQAEYDKLDDVEKRLYKAIPPPVPVMGHPAPTDYFGRPVMGGWRQRNGFHFGGGGGGCGGGRGNHGGNQKLAARFVRDVSIFDGTQMAPSTKFTKIWRLKNAGESAWPMGTRMIFVGGDPMTSEMSVPLPRGEPVPPGAEVDVAVEMVAPSELGRYLGYWRLAVCPKGTAHDPFGRSCPARKFGQRVWCHVQVVDPCASSALELPTEDDLNEIEKKKSALVAADAEADEESLAPPAAAKTCDGQPTTTPTAMPVAAAVPEEEVVPSEAVVADGADGADGGSEASMVLVGADDLDADDPDDPDKAEEEVDPRQEGDAPTAVAAEEAFPAGAAPSSSPSSSALLDGPSEQVKAALASMGFDNASMIQVVLSKHGPDLDACAADLAAATEWEASLDDLEEMGFTNRELCKTLMLKHDGNVKRTVKALVEDA